MADVHRELHELVDRAGPGVVDDAQHFRALLDDYLGEQAASRGELNLLVDAVRLGAAGRLLEQVAHGASPASAIDDQAELLARDRATGERASAAWALAALGFALGVVDEAEVGRRRADAVRIGALDSAPARQRPPSPAAWPTAPPPTTAPPTVSPTTAPPTSPPPSSPPATALPPTTPPRSAPTVAPRYAPIPAPTQMQRPPAAPPPPRRRTGRIVGLLALAVVLITGGVVALVALTGDDDPHRSAHGKSTDPDGIDPDRIQEDMTEILVGLARSTTAQEEFEASSWSVQDDNIVDRSPRPLTGDDRRGATTWAERRKSDQRRYWIYVEHLGEDYVAARDDISCEERNSGQDMYCAEHTTPDGKTVYENVTSFGEGKVGYYVFVPGDGAGQPEITIGESVDEGVVPPNETGKEAIPYFELEIDAVLDALDDERLDIPLPEEPPPLPSYQLCAYIYPTPAGHDCPSGLS